ncbi:serine hydrolase [Paracoccus pantotrophus]|uniref:serine hydrolase n=2 Tax=Paracoccus TaxID=265 RepID=UPI001E2A6AB9|nr:serine hydrolase [Paracoccus pantotrophus]
MNMNYGCVGLGLIAAGLAMPASAMSEAEFQQMAAGIFAPAIAEHDIPGLAVGATWRGQDYVYTAGMADRAAAVPVTAETLFELGSISKTFNVTLAALAAQQGRLSLADPVAAHLPDLKGSAIGSASLNPGQPRLVGRAFTLRFVPAREDLATPESWSSPILTRAAIEAMPEGCICVTDAMGSAMPGSSATSFARG